ncbi:MAG: hypothetical protein FWE27_07675 [Defluviitaleaceae bacterium]|nr:hypothetical protein [Defluviitaleaceae bacterium]
MSVFLFGLMFGLITSALMDLIGFILRPSGAYLPLMAVIVASGGFIRGGLWLL